MGRRITPDGPPSGPIPAYIKFTYSFLSFSLEATSTMWTSFEMIFLTDVALLSAGYAAWVAGIYRLFAGFIDPFVGNLTDKTSNSRWGRRRGWIIYSVLPYALLFSATWFVPGSNQILLFSYFLFMKCATDFAWSCLRVPQNALINDLSSDYHERYLTNIIRSAATGAGSIFSTILATILAKFVSTRTVRFPMQAGILCTIMVFATSLLVYSTRNYSKFAPTEEEKRGNLLSRCRDIFKCKAAVLVTIITSFSAIALQTTVTLVPYLLEDTLSLSEVYLDVLIVTVSLSGLITVVLILVFAKKAEKRTVYMVGASIWTLFYLCVPFMSKDRFWVMLPLAAFMGCGVGVSLLIPNSLITDAADFVELDTGLKLEGTIYGLAIMINKFLLGLVIFLFQEVLSYTGFDLQKGDKKNIPEKSKFAIMVMIIVFPTFFLIGTLVANYFLPITTKRMYEISQELERRRNMEGEVLQSFISKDYDSDDEEGDLVDDSPHKLLHHVERAVEWNEKVIDEPM